MTAPTAPPACRVMAHVRRSFTHQPDRACAHCVTPAHNDDE